MGKYVYVVKRKYWISGMSNKEAHNQFFYLLVSLEQAVLNRPQGKLLVSFMNSFLPESWYSVVPKEKDNGKGE